MILIAGVLLGGTALLFLVHVFFRSRLQQEQEEARQEVEAKVDSIRTRDEENDRALVEGIVALREPVDALLDQYQREREQLLVLENSATPWGWGPDDLQRWKEKEARRSQSRINRQLVLPWASTFLLLAGLTLSLAAVLYHLDSSRRLPPGGAFGSAATVQEYLPGSHRDNFLDPPAGPAAPTTN